MRKMKLDDDLDRNRDDEFQTDDEENLAERVCENGSDDESGGTPSSSRCPSNSSTEIWPQSYRASMDRLTGITSPSISFVKGSNVVAITSSLASACRRRHSFEHEPSLSKPLISEQHLEKGASTPRLPVKISGSSPSKLSNIDLPPPGKKSSFLQAVLNGINILCGVALLTTPYVIKEGGWLSLLALLLFAIICCWTGTLLKKCLESCPGLQTYPDIGQAAFGLGSRLAISIILYADLYASCVEYVIMMSDNLAKLFPNTVMDLAGIHLDSRQVFSITATLIVLPTVWLRDLSLLAYLSVGGVGSSILVVFCLFWVGVVDGVGFHPSGTALDLANLPVAIGIYGFGFSGHSVFPNIYSSMKEPSEFPSVLIVSFVFCWFMYTFAASCGFLMFGESTQSQYTLNMPQEFAASKIAIWTAVVNPMTKYALTITPVALSLEELMPSGRLRSHFVSLVIRTTLAISTLVVALTIPFFGSVMALIGSLLAMLIAFVFPCACYLRLFRGRSTKLETAACIFTISFGVINGCVGTYRAVKEITGQLG